MKGLLIAGALVLAIMFSGCGSTCVDHDKEQIKVYWVNGAQFLDEDKADAHLQMLYEKRKEGLRVGKAIDVVCKKCLK